ncbi:MAG: RdgB/HAM1 family non-canonical purine NTP pyrophosphatase [Ignavibacteria bacterium]
MKKILIASGNSHKINEISSIVSDIPNLEMTTLNNFGISLEVEENGSTLEGNALIKAKAVYNLLEMPVISDDTGLFTNSLNGEPGIYSARYAGNNATYEDNCNKLLDNLKEINDDKLQAEFKCCICLLINLNEYYFFEGICRGKICRSPKGENGFGYDPVFLPDGFEKTFAELNEEEKNVISHRGRALEKLKEFLVNYQ